MLGPMLGSLMSTASHANQRVDAFRDARAALQMIERDLRNLVPHTVESRSLSIPTPTPTSDYATGGLFRLDNVWQDPNDPTSVTPESKSADFGLVARKDAGSPTPSGDVCAVGYYCRWDSAIIIPSPLFP